MFKKITIPVDNSPISNSCIDMGVNLAKHFDSKLIGSHVYAANLHYRRFTDLEDGLPEQYKEEKELQRQRDLHDVLIGKGLEMISQSYLDVFKEKCTAGNVDFDSKLIEGKNYVEIVKDVKDNDYDLLILGVTGLGAVEGNLVGSVCERVVRRVKTDTIVLKNDRPIEGRIMVAIDGSSTSVSAVKSASKLGKMFGTSIELVSTFDPEYHRVAFKGIADVLSEEAGKIFKFSEQEKLHEDIIDTGMAKLYRSHLDDAYELIKDCGVEVKTTLLEGKPYYAILKYIKNDKPSLLMVGRTGIHDTGDLDIGSATENLLRLADCNIFIAATDKNQANDLHKKSKGSKMGASHKKSMGMPGGVETAADKKAGDKAFSEGDVVWTEDAQTRVEKIPYFIRGMIIKQIERFAKEKGLSEISSDTVDEVKNNWSDNLEMPH